MSTRSGKRLHSSFNENTIKADTELAAKVEIKTRKRKQKEDDFNSNEVNLEASGAMNKRGNYVTYPAEDEPTVNYDALGAKSFRKLRRNTLKEQNTQPLEGLKFDLKAVRKTRQSKRIASTIEDICENKLTNDHLEAGTKDGSEKEVKKSKKSKKKKKSIEIESTQVITDVENIANMENGDIKRKKGKKLKKKKKSNSSQEVKNSLNKSNVSSDSFHSAAGSPLKTPEKIKKRKPKTGEDNKEINLNSTADMNVLNNCSMVQNGTFDNEMKCKRKSVRRDASLDKVENVCPENNSFKAPNGTFDKNETISPKMLNATFEKEIKTRKSLRTSLATDNQTEVSDVINTTFEKSPKKDNPITVSLDTTFDKNDQLNSTFDKTEKLNSTFDKVNKTSSTKSSLISSDTSINVTFDKNQSRISITSDESKENIVNTTPVLIESSLDESQIRISKSKTPDKTPNNKMPENKLIDKMSSQTPLKREGTFTKDGPDVDIMSPKPKESFEKTPTKHVSLASPGFTPFRTHSQQKSVLNITRSIEKPTRRSSLAELVPRQTKVMFCSPVNNEAVVALQKRKVIKSSLKGSNKSFVFDESVPRPATRKRSYTLGGDGDGSRKRSRLADDLQQSVDRLSRPRTSSAAAKLDTPVKALTPSKDSKSSQVKAKSEAKLPRTKLPNFAALHQKRFAKMESLDECQERKAKRAKQLMTPNGAVAFLERISPKGTEQTVPVKVPSKSVNKKDKTEHKKPALPNTPKLPTLESLRPGFTRFGFRMNTEFNPFDLTAKSETEPKGNRPNGLKKDTTLPSLELKAKEIKPCALGREPTLPSLKGHTLKKETAKQIVMRERSATSLSNKRDVSRRENRTVIKGVRTNRRFELQMQMRNVN